MKYSFGFYSLTIFSGERYKITSFRRKIQAKVISFGLPLKSFSPVSDQKFVHYVYPIQYIGYDWVYVLE